MTKILRIVLRKFRIAYILTHTHLILIVIILTLYLVCVFIVTVF